MHLTEQEFAILKDNADAFYFLACNINTLDINYNSFDKGDYEQAVVEIKESISTCFDKLVKASKQEQRNSRHLGGERYALELRVALERLVYSLKKSKVGTLNIVDLINIFDELKLQASGFYSLSIETIFNLTLARLYIKLEDLLSARIIINSEINKYNALEITDCVSYLDEEKKSSHEYSIGQGSANSIIAYLFALNASLLHKEEKYDEAIEVAKFLLKLSQDGRLHIADPYEPLFVDLQARVMLLDFYRSNAGFAAQCQSLSDELACWVDLYYKKSSTDNLTVAMPNDFKSLANSYSRGLKYDDFMNFVCVYLKKNPELTDPNVLISIIRMFDLLGESDMVRKYAKQYSKLFIDADGLVDEENVSYQYGLSHFVALQLKKYDKYQVQRLFYWAQLQLKYDVYESLSTYLHLLGVLGFATYEDDNYFYLRQKVIAVLDRDLYGRKDFYHIKSAIVDQIRGRNEWRISINLGLAYFYYEHSQPQLAYTNLKSIWFFIAYDPKQNDASALNVIDEQGFINLTVKNYYDCKRNDQTLKLIDSSRVRPAIKEQLIVGLALKFKLENKMNEAIALLRKYKDSYEQVALCLASMLLDTDNAIEFINANLEEAISIVTKIGCISYPPRIAYINLLAPIHDLGFAEATIAIADLQVGFGRFSVVDVDSILRIEDVPYILDLYRGAIHKLCSEQKSPEHVINRLRKLLKDRLSLTEKSVISGVTVHLILEFAKLLQETLDNLDKNMYAQELIELYSILGKMYTRYPETKNNLLAIESYTKALQLHMELLEKQSKSSYFWSRNKDMSAKKESLLTELNNLAAHADQDVSTFASIALIEFQTKQQSEQTVALLQKFAKPPFNNALAIAKLASINFADQKLEEAKALYLRLLENPGLIKTLPTHNQEAILNDMREYIEKSLNDDVVDNLAEDMKSCFTWQLIIYPYLLLNTGSLFDFTETAKVKDTDPSLGNTPIQGEAKFVKHKVLHGLFVYLINGGDFASYPGFFNPATKELWKKPCLDVDGNTFELTEDSDMVVGVDFCKDRILTSLVDKLGQSATNSASKSMPQLHH